VQKAREVAKNESKFKDEALRRMEVLKAEVELLKSSDLSSMHMWKDKVNILKKQKNEILSQ